jgi:nitrite reductase/ring-hydroxylating ferredoxin subunit
MDGFVEVAKKDELGPGAMKKVSVAGHELLVARACESYYCADNRCPHLGGDLSHGTLEGTVVTCPDHYSRFDIASGSVIQWTNLAGVVARTARKVYDVLQCRDFSRMDFRLAPDGKLYFIEINPLPGLAPGYSDFPMLADFNGTDYRTLVRGVLAAALKRYHIHSYL